MQQRTLTWLSRGFAGAALGLAAVVFCGWILGIERWQNPVPGYVPMKCNTALAVLVLGVGVLLLTGEADKRRRRLAAVLAVFVLLEAGVTTLEFLAGWDLGIDTLLAPELPGAAAAAYPGRMAPPTMFALLAGAIALLLLAARRAHSLVRVLAGCGVLLGFLVLLGYTFEARYLYAAGFATNVDFTTGAAFLFLGTSFFLLDPPSLIRSPHAGGVLFRRMLPFVILAPWIIGWASQRGTKAGLYDFGIDQVLCIAPLMALLMLVLVTVAASLDRSDRERARKAEEIESLNRDLEMRVFERTLELGNANISLRRLNRDLDMLRRCNRALVRATDEDELLRAICDLAVNPGGYSLAWVGFAEQDERKTVRRAARSGPAAAYLDEISVSWSADDPFGRGPTGVALRENRPAIDRNSSGSREFEGWRQAAARYGICSVLALPLRSPDGVFGTLTLYSSDPEAFDEKEIGLFQELADDLAFGIMTLRGRQQIVRAEAAVVAERQKLNTILDMLPCYIALITRDHRVIYANREFQNRFGECHDRRCFEMLFGRGSPCQPCPTFSIFDTGTPLNREWVDSSGRSYEVCDFPFTDADGSKVILEMGLDSTERKRMQGELANGQFYVRSLIESSLDAMMTTDPAGTITDVNQQMERLTGQPRSALIGAAFRQFCGDPERAQHGIEQVLREGKVTDYELTVRSADHRETPVSYNANTFHDAAGKLRGVFAAARDISERKRMEGELALNERRYRSLVTATTQVVWMTGPDGQVDDMPMWRELTGQTREQVRGWGWLDALAPEDRERVAEAWNAARAQCRLYDVEYRVRHADGGCRDMAVRGVPVLHEDGTVREWIGTCTDISERKRAEQEIRQLNADLEERVRQRTAELESSNRDLEAFTYSVSHDLRAPLRHLDGFSRLLLEDYGAKLEAGAVQHLTRIRDAAGRLGQLVDDLLQFSRLGRHPLQPQITGLGAVVREVIADLAPETEGRDIQWRVGELPFAECDPALVKQVFANLLANAVKFTRPRSPAIIEVGQEVRNGEPVLFVRDNGVGFSMKYAAKLFGVFQRLHRSEDFEGTGVGLATVQRIVQKHGGRIWAEAELDRGAVFYFTLGPSAAVATPAETEETKERLAV